MDETDELVRKKQEERATQKMLQHMAEAFKRKRCKKCGLGMDQVEFGRHNKSVDKMQAWCKSCIIEIGSKGGRRRGIKPMTAIKLLQAMERLTKELATAINRGVFDETIDKSAQA